VTAAIFGLLGVLVGGVLNAAIARSLSKREMSDAVRAAARLFVDEMSHASNVVKFEDQVARNLMVPRTMVPTTERWTEYGELFARALPAMEWLKLRQAVVDLTALGHQLSLSETTMVREDSDPNEYTSVVEARSKALEVLMPLVYDGTYRGLRWRLRRVFRF
jgi:hypothetical protein